MSAADVEAIATVLAVFSVVGGFAAFVHYTVRLFFAVWDGIEGLVSLIRRRFTPVPRADRGPRDVAL